MEGWVGVEHSCWVLHQKRDPESMASASSYLCVSVKTSSQSPYIIIGHWKAINRSINEPFRSSALTQFPHCILTPAYFSHSRSSRLFYYYFIFFLPTTATPPPPPSPPYSPSLICIWAQDGRWLHRPVGVMLGGQRACFRGPIYR